MYSRFLLQNFKNLNGLSVSDFFKAKMMIAGLLNLLLLNAINIFLIDFSIYQHNLSLINFTIWLLMLLMTPFLKNITTIYKAMTIYGAFSTSLHALWGGGIYSSYIIWFPIICLGMSIFLNRNYSVAVSIYSVFSISMYVLLDKLHVFDFKQDIDVIPVWFQYINLISVITMLALILFFFFTKENLDIIWHKQKDSQINELEYLLEQKNLEIKKMRSEMATEFHDEMGNKLALISTYINVLQLQNIDERLKVYLDKINNNAKLVYEGTRDFIWTIESEHANMYELGVYLRDFGERLFLPVDVDFITDTLDPCLKNVKTSFVENHQIILVFKEAMTNTLKYSKSQKVEFKITKLVDTVRISLKDNGVGFDTQSKGRVYGLDNMQHRSEKIGAQLKIYTEIGSGVEVVLFYKITHLG